MSKRPTLGGPLPEHDVVEHAGTRPRNQAPDRNRETHLAPAENGVRHMPRIACRSTYFVVTPRNFIRCGIVRRELHRAGDREMAPGFRSRRPCSSDPASSTIRGDMSSVGVQQSIQQSRRRHSLQASRCRRIRIDGLQLVRHVRGQQLFLLAPRKDREVVEVACVADRPPDRERCATANAPDATPRRQRSTPRRIDVRSPPVPGAPNARPRPRLYTVIRYRSYPARVSSLPFAGEDDLTCFAASCDTKFSATLDGCAMGSSSCQTRRGSASKNSSGSTTTSWWSVRYRSATRRA